jgi:hypothetical protein
MNRSVPCIKEVKKDLFENGSEQAENAGSSPTKLFADTLLASNNQPRPAYVLG